MRPGYLFFIGMLTMGAHLQATAQWTLSGELRTRTEWRDGYGTLQPVGNHAGFFTSQRSRLAVDFQQDGVTFHSTFQDVRVWGQDASTFSPADGNKLAIHEAWAEIRLAGNNDSAGRTASRRSIDYLGVRIGRQELSYDDQRLLGALDWLQQARRHDAILFKLRSGSWQVDLGGAFNQNSDAVNYNGTFYTPANTLPYIKDSRGRLAPTPPAFIPLVNAAGLSSADGAPAVQNPASTNGLYQDYKALQYLYVARTFNNTRISSLLVVDQFGKYTNDSVVNLVDGDTGYIYGKHFNHQGVNTRFTGGVQVTSRMGSLQATAGLYYQTGHDRDAKQLDAWTSTVSISYTREAFTGVVGWDYLSGNNAYSASTSSHRFDPLYGTPHIFWGTMDYFYGSTGSPSGGLNDLFLKGKYTAANKRLTAGLNYHIFLLAEDQRGKDGRPLKKHLGSELDGVSSYALNKATSLQLGCSWMAATRSMEYAKNVPPNSSHLTAWWSYLMITVLFNNRSNKSK